MPELTLETLDRRLAELERRLALPAAVVPPVRDWRSVVGISTPSEFSRQMQAEMDARREAERQEASQAAES